MNNPAKLSFREWKKSEIAYELHAWRPQEGLIFVSNAQEGQKVIQLIRPCLPLNQVTRTAPVFPDSLPSKIAEIRLVPPPCRADEAEAELLRQQAAGQEVQPSGIAGLLHRGPPNWELARLKYDDEILFPQTGDLLPLLVVLKQFLADRQQEYDTRKIELAELQALDDRRVSIIGRARYYSDLTSCPAGALGWRRGQERQRLELGFPRGCLKWTIDEARRRPSLRNPIILTRWANAHNLTLDDMAAQRRQFLSTLPPQPASKDILASLGLHRQPDILGRLLGYPQRYDPLNELEESIGVSGDATWEQLTFCAQARFLITFEDGTKAWLAGCPRRAPQNQSERQEFAAPQAPALVLSNNDTVRIEKVAAEIASALPRREAVPKQLAAKTQALAEVIEPLNRLYSDVELAEIRKRAVFKGVPDLFADWALMDFQRSNPPRLPTKGDAFNNCGPGTLIGKKLEQAGFGISKQRFADHLTVLRRLLVEKGWLATPGPGKSRKRESNLQPDDRFEDFNQPTPAESAEDRDDERQAAALESEAEDDQEQTDKSSKPSDAD